MNKSIKQIILVILLGLIGGGLGWLVNTLRIYWLTYSLLWLVGILLTLAAKRLWTNPPKKEKIAELLQGLTLSFFSLFFLLLVLEFIFKVFVARSDHLAFTLSSRNWFERYWHLNTLGYRDEEWTEEKLAGRERIVVLGDSFAAGFGVKNPEDRLSNQLEDLLGEDYAVMTVARGGVSTDEEYSMLVSYPYQPDMVILVYYINDVIVAAGKHGMVWTDDLMTQYQAPEIVFRSYFLNFVYYQVVRLPALHHNVPYYDFIYTAYQDPAIWQTHEEELLAIDDWCEERDIPLVVVIFPSLTDPERTASITGHVEDTFEMYNVPVLNLTETMASAEPADLVVNSVDAHPNEAVHHQVAEMLYDLLIEEGLVEP